VFGKAAGFGSNIDLSSLDGTTGFKLSGAAALDYSGWSVASAGDVNGDGFDDLIVGARRADANGINSGASHVVFGRAGGFASNIDLSSLDGTTGFKLSGVAAYDQSGWSVASAGDINGDGFADLIVGARYADANGPIQARAMWCSDERRTAQWGASAVRLRRRSPAEISATRCSASAATISFTATVAATSWRAATATTSCTAARAMTRWTAARATIPITSTAARTSSRSFSGRAPTPSTPRRRLFWASMSRI
jgi:hypothetical protein